MPYEFRCRDADHVCGWRGRADTQEALIGRFAEHVRERHGVPRPTDTIVNYIRTKIRHV